MTLPMTARYGLNPWSDHADVRYFCADPKHWGEAALFRGEACVYLMHELQPDGSPAALLYVGISEHPRTRWTAHRSDHRWWPRVGLIEQRVCPDRETALDHEAELIRAFLPPFNGLTGLRWPGDRR